jgi:hypothetical protein
MRQLTVEEVVKASGGSFTVEFVEQLFRHSQGLADNAIVFLLDKPIMTDTMASWCVALKRIPHIFPLETGTLADYNSHGLANRLITSNHQHFEDWLNMAMSDSSLFDELRNQAILRNLYAIAVTVAGHQFNLVKEMAHLERELQLPDYTVETKWLSKLLNGVQLHVMAIYVIEKFVEQSGK